MQTRKYYAYFILNFFAIMCLQFVYNQRLSAMTVPNKAAPNHFWLQEDSNKPRQVTREEINSIIENLKSKNITINTIESFWEDYNDTSDALEANKCLVLKANNRFYTASWQTYTVVSPESQQNNDCISPLKTAFTNLCSNLTAFQTRLVSLRNNNLSAPTTGDQRNIFSKLLDAIRGPKTLKAVDPKKIATEKAQTEKEANQRLLKAKSTFIKSVDEVSLCIKNAEQSNSSVTENEQKAAIAKTEKEEAQAKEKELNSSLDGTIAEAINLKKQLDIARAEALKATSDFERACALVNNKPDNFQLRASKGQTNRTLKTAQEKKTEAQNAVNDVTERIIKVQQELVAAEKNSSDATNNYNQALIKLETEYSNLSILTTEAINKAEIAQINEDELLAITKGHNKLMKKVIEALQTHDWSEAKNQLTSIANSLKTNASAINNLADQLQASSDTTNKKTDDNDDDWTTN